jgi:hypothetical protein
MPDAFCFSIMDRETLIDALKAMNAATFLEKHVFESVPHMFGGNRGAYIGWERALVAGIDVDPACLMVIGSAAVGCSPNPSKTSSRLATGRILMSPSSQITTSRLLGDIYA